MAASDLRRDLPRLCIDNPARKRYKQRDIEGKSDDRVEREN